jgi:outer membrane protein OmpA-like peptidoglycan-associated protein
MAAIWGHGYLRARSRFYIRSCETRHRRPIATAADATGSAASNLQLSQRRAQNVLKGLVSRGIPIERFQVLAKGGTDPAVPTPPGVGEERNRCVELTWR